MPTEHCKKCEPDKSCGNLHLYVIELKKEVEKEFKRKSKKGYLYVGSTGKSVEERFDDNFIKEDGKWKYNSKNVKRIRKYFKKFRPELLYGEINPLYYDKNDKGQLERREGKLVDKLDNKGYRVEGPSWKKVKKAKEKLLNA